MDETTLNVSTLAPGHLTTEQISLALDGLLDAVERQVFDVHLQECEQCRHLWMAWSRISDALQVEPFHAPAPGFILRVDRAIQRDEKRRERLWGGVVVVGGTMSIWTMLLISLALAVTVGVTVIPGAQPSLQQVVGYGQQLIMLLVQYVGAVRDSLLALLPGPFAAAGLVAALGVLALIWLRLVRSPGWRSREQRASTNTHQE